MAAPLTILHLDPHVVAVDKPAGLLVHKTRSGADEEALLQQLRDQLGQRLYPVHRLDRPASGVIAFALDPKLTAALQAGFQADDAVKEYLVLTRGVVAMAFESRRPLIDDKGVLRDAWTEVAPVMRFPGRRCSLLRVRIHTGRQHQIRRHLACADLNVLGDHRYGNARENRVHRTHGLARMFLHAWRLDVAHPTGGRLSVTAPLPADLRAFMARLPGVDEALLATL